MVSVCTCAQCSPRLFTLQWPTPGSCAHHYFNHHSQYSCQNQNSTVRYTTRASLKSKEDKIKLEPSVATGCVDGSTPVVWYAELNWYSLPLNCFRTLSRSARMVGMVLQGCCIPGAGWLYCIVCSKLKRTAAFVRGWALTSEARHR